MLLSRIWSSKVCLMLESVCRTPVCEVYEGTRLRKSYDVESHFSSAGHSLEEIYLSNGHARKQSEDLVV